MLRALYREGNRSAAARRRNGVMDMKKLARVAALIGGASVLTVGLGGCESDAEKAMLYGAWCKTQQCNNLSMDEWQALRKNHLLPGQPPPDDSASNAVMAGVIAGSIAGSSSGGRR